MDKPSTPVNQSRRPDRTLLKTFFQYVTGDMEEWSSNWKRSRCGSMWSAVYWERRSVISMSQKLTNKLQSASRNLVLSIGGEEKFWLGRWKDAGGCWGGSHCHRGWGSTGWLGRGPSHRDSRWAGSSQMKLQGHSEFLGHMTLPNWLLSNCLVFFFLEGGAGAVKEGAIYNESPWFSRQT